MTVLERTPLTILPIYFQNPREVHRIAILEALFNPVPLVYWLVFALWGNTLSIAGKLSRSSALFGRALLWTTLLRRSLIEAR